MRFTKYDNLMLKCQGTMYCCANKKYCNYFKPKMKSYIVTNCMINNCCKNIICISTSLFKLGLSCRGFLFRREIWTFLFSWFYAVFHSTGIEVWSLQRVGGVFCDLLPVGRLQKIPKGRNSVRSLNNLQRLPAPLRCLPHPIWTNKPGGKAYFICFFGKYFF